MQFESDTLSPLKVSRKTGLAHLRAGLSFGAALTGAPVAEKR